MFPKKAWQLSAIFLASPLLASPVFEISDEIAEEASGMIIFWDNIKEDVKSFDEVTNPAGPSQTVKLSYDQKIKHWKNRKEKLKLRLEKNVDQQLKEKAKAESVSEKTFLSGVFGAKFFRNEVFASRPERLKRSDALIKKIVLEILSDRLRTHQNFDPLKWGLSANELNAIEERISLISEKIGAP